MMTKAWVLLYKKEDDYTNQETVSSRSYILTNTFIIFIFTFCETTYIMHNIQNLENAVYIIVLGIPKNQKIFTKPTKLLEIVT